MIKKQLILLFGGLLIAHTTNTEAMQSGDSNLHTNSLTDNQATKKNKKNKDTHKQSIKVEKQENPAIRPDKEKEQNNSTSNVVNDRLSALENEIQVLGDVVIELKKASIIFDANDKERLEIVNRDIDLHELATSTLGEVNLLKKSLKSIKELSEDGSLSNIAKFSKNVKNLKAELISQGEKIKNLHEEIKKFRGIQTDVSQISELDRRMILALAQNGAFESVDKLLESNDISQSDKDIITEIKTLGRKISSKKIKKKVADEEFKKILSSSPSPQKSGSEITQALTNSLLVLSNNIKPVKFSSDDKDDGLDNTEDLKTKGSSVSVSHPKFEDELQSEDATSKIPKINKNSNVKEENDNQTADNEEILDILGDEDNEEDNDIEQTNDKEEDDPDKDDDLLE